MTITNVLMSKHKVMTCVFDELYQLYGQPSWLIKPKYGQDPKVIIEEWIKKLGDYDDHVLKRACRNLYANNKVSTFPSLAHILAEVKDIKVVRQVEETKKAPAEFCSIERAFQQRDMKLGKPFYIPSRYKRAIDYVVYRLLKDDMGEAEYKALEHKHRDDLSLWSIKYRLAVERDLFRNFDEILKNIYDL